MTEGYTPSAPPMERPKRGPKPGSKRGPRAQNGTAEAATEVIDTLDVYTRMSTALASLPAKHRRSIMQALNERFPA